MKVLVTAASKHGATQGIAEAIGTELSARGLEVTVCRVEDVDAVRDYDAVVLGSAIYLGKWMKSAKQFVTSNDGALSVRPVWLFSSGPVPRPDTDVDDSVDRRDGDRLVTAIGARDHRVFLGKIDRSQLSLIERAPVRMAKLPDVDLRPWDEIRLWADGIAEALGASTSA